MSIRSGRARGVGISLWIGATLLFVAAVVAGARDRKPAAPAGREVRPNFVTGEVIVALKDAPTGGIGILSEEAVVARDQANLARLQSKYGVQSRGPVFQRVHEKLRQGRSRGGLGMAATPEGDRRSRELLRFYTLRTERDVQAVCAELKADPAVALAQPNYIYYPCRMPNDPDFADQYAHQLIQMEDAWDISTGSRDVVIAVLGTGVDVNHPDLKDNIWVNAGEIPGNGVDDEGNGFIDDIHGWNFDGYDGDVTPWVELDDIVSHETEVAGVIGAVGDNGLGVCGVNWQCSLMALRMSLFYTSEEVAGGLDYATANGARIVNMSFGGDVFGPEGDPVVREAIDNAYEQGVLLVASAGNADTSYPNYPAAYPNVLAVASTNGEDMKTGHSTFGPWVDLAAPGTDIVTTTLYDGYVSTAGTSFSSPYVAAIAGLVLAHRPELTHTEVRAILENTADPIYYGVLDPNLGYVGTGRANAYRALLAADDPQPLSEVFFPMPGQVFPADGNAIDLRLFVHGESYRVDYRHYGDGPWTMLAEEPAPTDPNGLVRVPLANPGVGTYEARIRVTRGERTHTDRRLFRVTDATEQAHWPLPRDASDADLYYFIYMGSPLCLDVNGDGRNEVVQLSLDLLSFYGGGVINLWTADGQSLPNWPVEMEYAWPSSAAVGDIDGDGDYEVVVACEYDGEVYAYHIESGQLVDGDWPSAVGGWYGYVTAGPTLADLDGDGDSEILVALDLESSDTDGLIALQGDGSYLWQRRYTSYGPLVAADLDRDGDVEIGLSGYGPGLSRLYTFLIDHRGQQIARWLGGSLHGTAAADLEGDGTSELLFCTDKEVAAVRADGATAWKTRVDDPLDIGGGLCAGDLDNDGRAEVYMTTFVEGDGFLFTRVYAFDHEGRLRTEAGFPKTLMGDPWRCTPLVADIDGDGQKELIVSAAGEPLMAWEYDGAVAPGFPMLGVASDYECSPTLADLDGDGDMEILIPADDYRFHVLDLTAPYAADRVDWGMLRHDAQNSSWLSVAPRVDPISAPAQVMAGQPVEIPLAALNPADLALRWLIGDAPQGAQYDPNAGTISWVPTLDQAFLSHAFQLLVTDGVRQDRQVFSVAVVSNAIYHADMSTDPNWTLDPGWAWGVPTGKGGDIRNEDPRVARTGEQVVGYALSGNYRSNLEETRYATTPPIDCRGFKDIRLGFWRWLTVDSPDDQANLQVSSDGTIWTDLWTAAAPAVRDDAWQSVEYAVPPELGDDQPTVYFRWGMGPTNGLITRGGWNLDDVQVTGELMPIEN